MDTKATWKQIEHAFDERKALPCLGLRPPASEASIAALERHLGVTLPDAVRAFLAIHDGQADRTIVGLFFGDLFLSADGIQQEWDTWRSLDGDEVHEAVADSMSSRPPGVIRPVYNHRGWIPLTHDGSGNHVGLDFAPAEGGRPGQVIAFGRDEDEKRLLAPSFDDLLSVFARRLERPDWTVTDEGWQPMDLRFPDWQGR